MFKCDNCGFEKNGYFGICPSCHNGVGVEVEGVPSDRSSETVKINFRRVDPNVEKDTIIRTTQYPNFDAILSTGKGMVEGQVILLGAIPGCGKSTLCMSIADRDTLYISSEENYNQVNQRALRVHPNCECSIVNTTYFEEVKAAITQWSGNLVIIDSINSIDFGVGYATTAKYAAEITQLLKSSGKAGIIISQVNRDGEITGMQSIMHVVDTVLHMERSEVTGNIIATSSKNRYGEIGSVAVFEHLSNGFVEISVDHSEVKMEVGNTYTETRFGHKCMTIGVEALVAPSQAAFGIRKANGYNYNRLVQVVGILSYYGSIDLTRKDIYVALSSGLSTDDVSIELAIANSILSSYYGKAAIGKASGQIRLNGKINSGYADGQPIYHIHDLLSIYNGK